MTSTSDELPQEDPSEPSFAHGPVDPSGDTGVDTDVDTDEMEVPGPESNQESEPTD